MLRGLPIALLPVSLLLAGTARAADDEAIRRYVGRAVVLYELGEYRESIAALEKGYLAAPLRPDFPFNIAATRGRLGDLEAGLDNVAAMREYRLAIATWRELLEGRHKRKIKWRDRVERNIAETQEKLDKLQAEEDKRREPGAKEMTKQDEEAKRRVADDVQRQIDGALEKKAAEERRFWAKLGLASVGVGGAAALTGFILLMRGENIGGQLKVLGDGVGRASADQLRDTKELLDKSGTALVATGAACLAAGVLMLALPPLLQGRGRILRVLPTATGVTIEGVY